MRSSSATLRSNRTADASSAVVLTPRASNSSRRAIPSFRTPSSSARVAKAAWSCSALARTRASRTATSQRVVARSPFQVPSGSPSINPCATSEATASSAQWASGTSGRAGAAKAGKAKVRKSRSASRAVPVGRHAGRFAGTHAARRRSDLVFGDQGCTRGSRLRHSLVDPPVQAVCRGRAA